MARKTACGHEPASVKVGIFFLEHFAQREGDSFLDGLRIRTVQFGIVDDTGDCHEMLATHVISLSGVTIDAL